VSHVRRRFDADDASYTSAHLLGIVGFVASHAAALADASASGFSVPPCAKVRRMKLRTVSACSPYVRGRCCRIWRQDGGLVALAHAHHDRDQIALDVSTVEGCPIGLGNAGPRLRPPAPPRRCVDLRSHRGGHHQRRPQPREQPSSTLRLVRAAEDPGRRSREIAELPQAAPPRWHQARPEGSPAAGHLRQRVETSNGWRGQKGSPGRSTSASADFL
jgi:hypothetical protein